MSDNTLAHAHRLLLACNTRSAKEVMEAVFALEAVARPTSPSALWVECDALAAFVINYGGAEMDPETAHYGEQQRAECGWLSLGWGH